MIGSRARAVRLKPCPIPKVKVFSPAHLYTVVHSQTFHSSDDDTDL